MPTLATTGADSEISSSLEDYLETIYLLVQEQGFARVKDVARERDVKAASVSIALRRLAELALVRYERREYIALTPAGEQAGRRVFSRHRLLLHFFQDVLKMEAKAASAQACAMEHSLTDEAMDGMARFLEFLSTCPSAIESFHACPALANRKPAGKSEPLPAWCASCGKRKSAVVMSLAEVRPGRRAVVTKIGAGGVLRQRLLDMGVLPESLVEVERVGLGGDPFWVCCQGAHLALRRSEAQSILVRPADGDGAEAK
jgi:DtxR family transcriptional regulator, Mn-dependent transcriptional regulator